MENERYYEQASLKARIFLLVAFIGVVYFAKAFFSPEPADIADTAQPVVAQAAANTPAYKSGQPVLTSYMEKVKVSRDWVWRELPLGVKEAIYLGNHWYAFELEGQCYLMNRNSQRSDFTMAHKELCTVSG